jgi:copper(I)-binding protein
LSECSVRCIPRSTFCNRRNDNGQIFPAYQCNLLVEAKGPENENRTTGVYINRLRRSALGPVRRPARAEEVKAGDLVITQAWSRATPGGAKIAGGFLTIENKGSAADRLIGGSGDVAAKVEVHEMTMNNGVMTMRPLDKGLTIEPGKAVKLAPGGYHLMLFDLKSPLKQGDKVPLTLEFERAGKVKLSFEVQGVGAQGPAAAGSSSGHMNMNMNMKK